MIKEDDYYHPFYQNRLKDKRKKTDISCIIRLKELSLQNSIFKTYILSKLSDDFDALAKAFVSF